MSKLKVKDNNNTWHEIALTEELPVAATASEQGLIFYAQGTFIISANGFTADTTYTDYPFRKDISVTGCTANHFAEIALDLAAATGGNIAPICETHDGGIYIYAKAQNTSAITGSYKISYNG